MFETLGQYKILDALGAGGMGQMFRARDTRSGRTVAIKVIDPEIAANPARRPLFMADAQAAVSLSHPNIALLYEVVEDQGQLFVVYEYVPGETLKNTVAGRPLNPRRAIDLSVQIADALADAHASDLIHRDIGSNTIIVTPKGNAKVLDFGLARWTAGDPTVYSSPEEAPGHPVDYRTDIFSVGVVMFEMLTGRLPFPEQPAAPPLPAGSAAAPPPSSVNRSLTTEFDPIVSKAMAPAAADRYQSAATLAAELRALGAVLDARSAAQEAAAALTVAPPGRRSAARWFALLAFLAALAAVAWYERAAIRGAWQRAFEPAPTAVIIPIPSGTEAAARLFTDGFARDSTSRLRRMPGC
jgi:serine/threonine protein kinase